MRPKVLIDSIDRCYRYRSIDPSPIVPIYVRMAIKKCVAVQQGSRNTPLKAPPPTTLQLIAWKSFLTPSRLECAKTPPQTGGSFYFLTEKSHKTAFFYKNLSQDVILTHLVKNRSRIITIFTSGHFELLQFKYWGSNTPPAIRIRIHQKREEVKKTCKSSVTCTNLYSSQANQT